MKKPHGVLEIAGTDLKRWKLISQTTARPLAAVWRQKAATVVGPTCVRELGTGTVVT